MGGKPIAFESKAHFYNAAAEAMKRILVDHTRSRNAGKRGGGRQRVDLGQVHLPAEVDESVDYEKLDGALNQLKRVDDRRYRVVMLRYFAGLTEQQISQTLNVAKKTVQRDWNAAKVFLLMRMRE